MAEYILNTNQLREYCSTLKAGDRVLLSGEVFTSRDAAHKRLSEMLKAGEALPFELKDASIYYAGPTPTKPGDVIGSCGPTTSGRMDVYAPMLLDAGLCCMIGKGERNKEVVDAIKRNNCVYLCAIGGAGALASKCISECEEIAFFDLGCESIKRLIFNNFPLVVGIDSKGSSLFKKFF
ncbi:MAG: fumarate hydratase C-terminal domain-containing protein [Clostridia bacterium]|nr:fumarate hydratase C-terminal domain-containing protein [Clostridia bacterium]MBQ7046782.1 fumarate hydratase C-terminal domain-containing protein [Oscillospiraceae bacterium]